MVRDSGCYFVFSWARQIKHSVRKMSILPSNYSFWGGQNRRKVRLESTTRGIPDDAGLDIWTGNGKLRLLSQIEERKWLDSFF